MRYRGGLGRRLPADRTTRLPAAVRRAPGGRLASCARRCASCAGPRPDAERGTAGSLGRPGSLRHLPDGRTGLRVAVATLAGLLDRRVEAVDVGHAAGSRVLAAPDGRRRAPRDARRRRSSRRERCATSGRSRPSRAGAPCARTRSRSTTGSATCGSRPGATRRVMAPRLRLAALRARPCAPRRRLAGTAGPTPRAGADLLVGSGGAFAAIPPRGRRAGGRGHDAPAGRADPVPRPRAGPGARSARCPTRPTGGGCWSTCSTTRCCRWAAPSSRPTCGPAAHDRDAAHHQQPPAARPGAARRARSGWWTCRLACRRARSWRLREGSLLGARSRRMALDVTGGLGGLLVDTREMPAPPARARRAPAGAAGGLGAPGLGGADA